MTKEIQALVDKSNALKQELLAARAERHKVAAQLQELLDEQEVNRQLAAMSDKQKKKLAQMIGAGKIASGEDVKNPH